MASKGQKFKSFSPEVKNEILNRYFSGNFSTSMLSREYNVSVDTIRTWLKKIRKGIDITVDHRPGNTGRKSKSDNENYKEKYEILKKFQAFLKAQREKK